MTSGKRLMFLNANVAAFTCTCRRHRFVRSYKFCCSLHSSLDPCLYPHTRFRRPRAGNRIRIHHCCTIGHFRIRSCNPRNGCDWNSRRRRRHRNLARTSRSRLCNHLSCTRRHVRMNDRRPRNCGDRNREMCRFHCTSFLHWHKRSCPIRNAHRLNRPCCTLHNGCCSTTNHDIRCRTPSPAEHTSSHWDPSCERAVRRGYRYNLPTSIKLLHIRL